MDISVTEQGPYVVRGVPVHRGRAIRTEHGEPVAWQHDADLEAEETYELCRCGGSQSKPFCDGTHETRDWDGTETAPANRYDERAATYEGTGITVRDDRSICEHAGFCSNKASNVWKLTADSAATATRSQIAGMVDRCPSGALTYRLDGTTEDLEPRLAPGITVIDDGPLWVTGRVPVHRTDGTDLEHRNRLTLCRCGASKNKPLCDGSHTKTDFRDSARQDEGSSHAE